MQRLRTLDPALRLSNLNAWLPIDRPRDPARFADGLRPACLRDAGIAHNSSTPPRGWSSLD